MKWILALITLALVSNSWAEPRQWEHEGVPVRAVRPIDDIATAAREDGTTLLVWGQSLGAEPVVMGQLFSPAGITQWEEGGRVLAQGFERAGLPVTTAVDGGWVIAWLDAQYMDGSRGPELGWYSMASLRVIKIDDTGLPVWSGGLAGIEIVAMTEWWYPKSYEISSSGAGALVSWESTADHWVQRLDEDGQLVWPEAVHLPVRQYSSRSAIASDLFGGLIFTWSVVRAGDTLLFANRLLPDGTFAWNDTSGVEVSRDDDYFDDVNICPDATGGAYVVWRLNDDEVDPMAQRVSAQGAVMWPIGGVTLADLTGYREILAIEPSFLGGAPDGLLVVIDQENQPQRMLFAQKVSLLGAVQWGIDAATICEFDDNTEYYYNVRLLSDQAGGALCYFNHQISSQAQSNELTVARIAADESRPWSEECGIVAGTSDGYGTTLSSPTLAGNALQVFWRSDPYYSNNQVQTQRLDLANGALQYELPHVIATGDAREVRDLQAVSLFYGSSAVAWTIWTGSTYSVFFQILNVFGQPMFGEHGVPLCTEDGVPISGENCALCPDGSGGFFAVFRSYDFGFYIARAVHFDGQGQILSDPAGEVIFDTEDWIESYKLFCIPDGTGGCYVSAAIYNTEFYLNSVTTRINTLCEPVWNEPVVFTDPTRDVYTTQVVPSENNSCIVVYTPLVWGSVEVRAAQLGSDGTVLWNLQLEDDAHTYYYDHVAACADMQLGCNVVWATTNEAGTIQQARVQRVSPTGERLWGTEGLLVYSDSSQEARDFSGAADVVGNLTLAWSKFNWTDMDLFAQRITPGGSVLWQENGLPLSTADFDQERSDVIVLSDNEVYVVWGQNRSELNGPGDNDIYATHLNARGQIGDDSYWQENGSPVCNHDYYQMGPVSIADGAGGVLVAWADQRTGFYNGGSVFAQRLYDPIFTDADEPPVIPLEFSLSQNYPNPFNPETVIEFALPTATNATMKVFDVTGRTVATLVDEPLTAGMHRVNFNAQSLASGVYFYTLRAADHTMTKKMVLLR